MPEPTIQDVLDAISSLEDDVRDIKTKCNDLHPIKTKVDEILNKNNVSILCPSCDGSGIKLRSVDHGNGVIGPDTEEYPCPKCAGTGEKIFGKLETGG